MSSFCWDHHIVAHMKSMVFINGYTNSFMMS